MTDEDRKFIMKVSKVATETSKKQDKLEKYLSEKLAGEISNIVSKAVDFAVSQKLNNPNTTPEDINHAMNPKIDLSMGHETNSLKININFHNDK